MECKLNFECNLKKAKEIFLLYFPSEYSFGNLKNYDIIKISKCDFRVRSGSFAIEMTPVNYFEDLAREEVIEDYEGFVAIGDFMNVLVSEIEFLVSEMSKKLVAREKSLNSICKFTMDIEAIEVRFPF